MPSNKTIKNIIALFIISLLFACGSSNQLTPEQRVENTLESIELAVEERSLSKAMQHISDQYRDPQGNDKQAIQRLLQLQYIKNQKINIFSVVRSLEVDGSFASAEVSAAMSSREVDLADESNRLRADTHRFSIALAEEDGIWRVRSVNWQPGW